MNKRKLLAALMTAFVMMNVYSAKAQETFEFKPSVNVSYGINQIHSTKFETIAPTGLIAIDADLFEIFPRLSGGFHLGFETTEYSYSTVFKPEEIITGKALMISHGFDLHYALFNFKDWNIQLGATIGSTFSKLDMVSVEYGLSATVKYFPIEHLGVFAEGVLGNYSYARDYSWNHGFINSTLKAGVSYKF